MTRLISVGNAVVDLIARVPRLPASGEDVTADASTLAVGGSATTMIAARRQGIAAAYGGAHGTGPFGDRVRAALAAEGIELVQPPVPDADTGWDVALIEPGGERSFVTAVGAEAWIDDAMLAGLVPGDGDLVHVSGYGLARRPSGPAIARWVTALPATITVFFDPGPLIAQLDPALLDAVTDRADWWSGNEREAAHPSAGRARRLIVRLGADGCVVDGERVPGFAVDAIDLNGAGDVHAGVFLAALAAGTAPTDAARRANAAAAIAVTRPGPAVPTRVEVDALLAQ